MPGKEREAARPGDISACLVVVRPLSAMEAVLAPHPVVAPVALPAGQPALAELQIKPVLVKEQAAAADVAEGQEDFVARTAADVVQWHAQSARGVFRIHSEHQRR